MFQFIELPGQYDGLTKPQPEQHIKVSSFDATLLVMGSLRKPKRLKIRGNDERDYPYLVKGGEDLRLDQRVQQLFSVMNEILSNDVSNLLSLLPYSINNRNENNFDSVISTYIICMIANYQYHHQPACAKRRLKIKTYQVVPMTTRVGIIEWINNTKVSTYSIETYYLSFWRFLFWNNYNDNKPYYLFGLFYSQPIKEIIEEEIAREQNKKKEEINILKTEGAVLQDQWLKSFAKNSTKGKTTLPIYYTYITAIIYVSSIF